MIDRAGQLWLKTRPRPLGGRFAVMMLVVSTKEQRYSRVDGLGQLDLVEGSHTCIMTHADGRVTIDTWTECDEFERWEDTITHERLDDA